MTTNTSPKSTSLECLIERLRELPPQITVTGTSILLIDSPDVKFDGNILSCPPDIPPTIINDNGIAFKHVAGLVGHLFRYDPQAYLVAFEINMTDRINYSFKISKP